MLPIFVKLTECIFLLFCRPSCARVREDKSCDLWNIKLFKFQARSIGERERKREKRKRYLLDVLWDRFPQVRQTQRHINISKKENSKINTVQVHRAKWNLKKERRRKEEREYRIYVSFLLYFEAGMGSRRRSRTDKYMTH